MATSSASGKSIADRSRGASIAGSTPRGIAPIFRGRVSAVFCDSAGNVFAIAGAEGANAMLFIVFLCLLLWFLGFMTTTTLGGALHVLLIIAVVFLLLHVIQGRPIGD